MDYSPGHYYGTPCSSHVADNSAMNQKLPLHRTWGRNQRYLSISAEECLEGLSDTEEEGNGQSGMMIDSPSDILRSDCITENHPAPKVMRQHATVESTSVVHCESGLRTTASGGCSRFTLQDGGLGLRREIPGCVDPSDADKPFSAPPSNWKHETLEDFGLNFRGQAAPLLQVVRNSSELPAAECGKTTCGDFLVVVHGNCIVEYSKGEHLTLHSAVTKGDAVEKVQFQDWPSPPFQLARAPGCGQEAESGTEQESTRKIILEPPLLKVKPSQRATLAAAPPKTSPNIPILGPPRLPLPNYSAASSQSTADDSLSPPRKSLEQHKGRWEGNKQTSKRMYHGKNGLPAVSTARLTPVPVNKSSNGLGFQVTMMGPEGVAKVGDIWDRRACPLLAEGDVIVKANGADLRHLTALQVEEVLRQHTLEGDMVLLVQREASNKASSLHPTSHHCPHPLRLDTEEEAAQSKNPTCPPEPDIIHRGHGERQGCMKDGGTVRPSLGAHQLGTETVWMHVPQAHSNTTFGDQKHNRGKKLWPQRDFSEVVKPARTRLENVNVWAAPDDGIKATSFVDPIPCDLLLEQRSLLQSLAPIPSQPLHAYQELMSPRPGAHAPFPFPDLVTGQPQRPLLEARLTEVELERNEDEDFGFVIVSEIPASGQEARSLVPHKVSEVHQDSPAGRDGQLKVGDRVEGVDGRSITQMSPREITQLFRQAGTKIRLRILPKSEAGIESLSDAAEIEVDEKRMPSTTAIPGPHAMQSLGPKDAQPQAKPAEVCGQYLVELQRGPTGFGFSLRGGSEYNMSIYVLGIMEGGPAERSGKMQVSDQLMEINGTCTAGMSHADAVEQIRTGGNKIHLILRRGNGYVPDYDTHGSRSPNSELLTERKSRLSQKEYNSVPEPQCEQPPPEVAGVPSGHAMAHDMNSTKESTTNTKREPRGTARMLSEDPQSIADPGVSIVAKLSNHKGGRGEQVAAREGRPRGRRSGVKGEKLTTAVSLEDNKDPQRQPPRESKSLSPHWDRATGNGRFGGSSSLLGPRLRPSVEPGPWLVPSHERLTYTLQKDDGLVCQQLTDVSFSGGLWDLEAGEREKGEAHW
ncbi:PDZ domain-containing protein MAGIX isoform X2 [Ambystoma mexicanum]|uniref:PDZ domain-containing protein MAGIX isoform X2 n=1 Tax=Ambystoma mexicanum TaxID=8296 RepID=UPI0037E771D9